MIATLRLNLFCLMKVSLPLSRLKRAPLLGKEAFYYLQISPFKPLNQHRTKPYCGRAIKQDNHSKEVVVCQSAFMVDDKRFARMSSRILGEMHALSDPNFLLHIVFRSNFPLPGCSLAHIRTKITQCLLILKDLYSWSKIISHPFQLTWMEGR